MYNEISQATMDGKRQCPNCGRQFEDAYQFCPFDATSLGRKCPICGKVWDSAYQFCPLDSAPLSPRPAPPDPAPAPSRQPPFGPPRAAAPPVEAPGWVEPPLRKVPEAAPGMVEPPPAKGPESPSRLEMASAKGPEGPGRGEPLPALKAPGAAPIPHGSRSAYAPKPTAFTFADQVAPASWKTVVFRPVSILFAAGVLAVAFAVWYLSWRTSGPDLPLPAVSYTLLPNEGKTKGVPVAIKINQLAVFMIDDPMESGGATRAKQLVTSLEGTIRPLKPGSEVRFAVETVGGRPVILEVTQEGPQQRTLATVTEGDAVLAGEIDAMRLAAQWAERLTDAVKVFIFGEPPTFSTGTEFGQALLAMYKAATSRQGKVSKKSLDTAFQGLSAAQRRALETPPVAKRTSARAESPASLPSAESGRHVRHRARR